MAFFKEHRAVLLWKGPLIVGDDARDAMGHFGRITKVSDLPSKGEDTRKRRVETAVEWMAEGKSRNWKYEKR